MPSEESDNDSLTSTPGRKSNDNNNENKSIFISLYHRYEIRLNLIENKLTLVTVF